MSATPLAPMDCFFVVVVNAVMRPVSNINPAGALLCGGSMLQFVTYDEILKIWNA